MEKRTVLIEARPFCRYDSRPLERLKESNLNLTDMRGSDMGDQKFISALKTCGALICGNDLVVNEDVLSFAPNLKVLAKLGTGLDTVDITAATRKNVLVFHTPGANVQAVADHTFALMLSLTRKIITSDRSVREKRWEQMSIIGMEIWKKTIGIIGLGAIGRNVALRAMGFQMKILACDPYWPEEFARDAKIERVEINDLLRRSDIVTLHIPLTPANRSFINKKYINMMKPSAVVINTSRGGLIEEQDLYEALKNEIIAGAALDVFDNEPPHASPLLRLNNVVLTPHIAAFTKEAMNKMDNGIVDQLIGYYKNRLPQHAVNPQVFNSLPTNIMAS